MEFKTYTDDEVKAMLKLSKQLEPVLKIEAKAFLDRVERKYPKEKDGTMLRKLIFEQLKEFPMMTHYSHLILEEARKRGYKFEDDGDKLI